MHSSSFIVGSVGHYGKVLLVDQNTRMTETGPPGDSGSFSRQKNWCKGLRGWNSGDLTMSLGNPHAYRPKDVLGVASGDRFARPVCNIHSTYVNLLSPLV